MHLPTASRPGGASSTLHNSHNLALKARRHKWLRQRTALRAARCAAYLSPPTKKLMPSTSSRLLRMLPSKLVATTSYSPAFSAAMLRISSTTLPAAAEGAQMSSTVINPAIGQQVHLSPDNCCSAACTLREQKSKTGMLVSPAPKGRHSLTALHLADTGLPNVAFSSPPMVSPRRRARSSVTSPNSRARGIKPIRFCSTATSVQIHLQMSDKTCPNAQLKGTCSDVMCG